MANYTSTTRILNSSVPQGWVLRPLLYSLFTHDCFANHNTTSVIKFANNITVVDLMDNNKEEVIKLLAGRFTNNNLCVNIRKTKNLIVDFRR